MNAPAWPCICGGGPMNLKNAFKPKTKNMRPRRTRTMTMTYFIQSKFVISLVPVELEILSVDRLRRGSPRESRGNFLCHVERQRNISDHSARSEPEIFRDPSLRSG